MGQEPLNIGVVPKYNHNHRGGRDNEAAAGEAVRQHRDGHAGRGDYAPERDVARGGDDDAENEEGDERRVYVDDGGAADAGKYALAALEAVKDGEAMPQYAAEGGDAAACGRELLRPALRRGGGQQPAAYERGEDALRTSMAMTPIIPVTP